MELAGLQKLTLLDFPGHVACTVFTQGCSFRCPFCQNRQLLEIAVPPVERIPEETLLAYLQKRKGVLDGVCFTGGEPLLQRGLPALLQKVRALGYAVKLDTNGGEPDKLRTVLERGLVDRVSMDIKNAPARYGETIGVPGFDPARIKESAAILMDGTIPFEFRTTVVAEFHTPDDLLSIGEWLRGDEPYFLQAFVDSPDVLRKGLHAVPKATMAEWRELLLPLLPRTELRGV